MEDKATVLLRKLREYIKDSSGVGMTNLVYITPAQAMRNAADEIEAKDAFLREVDEFLSAKLK